MIKQQEYTPLPVSKWSNSSILKFHDSIWSNYLKVILDTNVLTKEEKNKRINNNLKWHIMIHDLCVGKELTIKKT